LLHRHRHDDAERRALYSSPGVSSLTLPAALSAYGLPAPTAPALAPFAYFTQESFWTSCVRAVPAHRGLNGGFIDARFVASGGSTLAEWTGALACYANTTIHYASVSTVDRFRASVSSALAARPPAMVGINFHRSGLGEVGGGHMSPIAAFEPTSDKLLLLDVSRYKYPAVWVDTAALFAAMNTTDSSSGQSRGWVTVAMPRNLTAMPPLPPPPPAVNFSSVSACLAALRTDDPYDVATCTRGGVVPAPAPACAPGRAIVTSGGRGVALPWALTCILAVALGGMVFQRYREAKAQQKQVAPEGVQLIP